MKLILTFLTAIISINAVVSQTVFEDKKGKKHYWGDVELNDLSSDFCKEWYDKNFEEHEVSLSEKDKSTFEGIEVEIYLGTWCGDTKYLLPRFVKEWKSMNLSENKLEFIALHREGDLYKQGPNKETMGKNIHKVPTFIFKKDGKEIGRIVERAVFDIGTDMILIAKEQPYRPRYMGQQIVSDFLNSFTGDTLIHRENINNVYREISREISADSELNAYGYVLKAQGEMEKAEFVFLLNRYLFPYSPNARDSYGEILFDTERWEESKEQYLEVLRLQNENENATKQLSMIYGKLRSDIKM